MKTRFNRGNTLPGRLLVLAILTSLLTAGCASGQTADHSVQAATDSSAEAVPAASADTSLQAATAATTAATAATAAAASAVENTPEFIEAVNTKTDEDEDDNYVLYDTAATVTVGPESTEAVTLPQGEYVLEIEAKGETNGDVVITIDKN
jgi:hypothetical protein